MFGNECVESFDVVCFYFWWIGCLFVCVVVFGVGMVVVDMFDLYDMWDVCDVGEMVFVMFVSDVYEFVI